jgi:hypothetical protein
MTHFNDRWSSSMVLTMESSRMIHGECVPWGQYTLQCAVLFF